MTELVGWGVEVCVGGEGAGGGVIQHVLSSSPPNSFDAAP